MSKIKLSVKNSSNVKRAGHQPRGSKYDDLIRKINKLKPGKTIVLPLPRGVGPRQMQIRLASIEARRIQQGLLTIPEGYRITHYATDQGELAIELAKV